MTTKNPPPREDKPVLDETRMAYEAHTLATMLYGQLNPVQPRTPMPFLQQGIERTMPPYGAQPLPTQMPYMQPGFEPTLPTQMPYMQPGFEPTLPTQMPYMQPGFEPTRPFYGANPWLTQQPLMTQPVWPQWGCPFGCGCR